jgi:hypothetical protein
MNKSKLLNILFIEKNSNIKQCNIKLNKNNNIDYDKLYKKCGFKSPLHFKKQYQTDIYLNDKKINITIFAKKMGRSNLKNNFKFQYPLENITFYGNICILANEYVEKNNFGRQIKNIFDLPKLITEICKRPDYFSKPFLPPNPNEEILKNVL